MLVKPFICNSIPRLLFFYISVKFNFLPRFLKTQYSELSLYFELTPRKMKC